MYQNLCSTSFNSLTPISIQSLNNNKKKDIPISPIKSLNRESSCIFSPPVVSRTETTVLFTQFFDPTLCVWRFRLENLFFRKAIFISPAIVCATSGEIFSVALSFGRLLSFWALLCSPYLPPFAEIGGSQINLDYVPNLGH